jgi:hypothetical protein
MGGAMALLPRTSVASSDRNLRGSSCCGAQEADAGWPGCGDGAGRSGGGQTRCCLPQGMARHIAGDGSRYELHGLKTKHATHHLLNSD